MRPVKACYYGMDILLDSGGAAGPGSAAPARHPEAAGGAGEAPELGQEEEETWIKEPTTDRDELKKHFHV